MRQFDVFNGDADGICALHQLRLAQPTEAVLITGVKRDISLLARVEAKSGDSVTVLDISLDKNRAALVRLLAQDARIEYFDHHFAGQIPESPNLHVVIDDSRDVCTSTLVDCHLGGKYRIWAIVGAFGDNLGKVGRLLAKSLGLQPERVAALQMLGESLNYNSYGESETDLMVPPADLYATLRRYSDPFRFMESEPLVRDIAEGQRRDLSLALDTKPEYAPACGKIYLLPDAAWGRRVRGIFANRLAVNEPGRAFAVLTPNGQGGYAVSVRAPLRARLNAHELCRRFPTGGGRVASAGINHLPHERLSDFVREFERAFTREA